MSYVKLSNLNLKTKLEMEFVALTPPKGPGVVGGRNTDECGGATVATDGTFYGKLSET